MDASDLKCYNEGKQSPPPNYISDVCFIGFDSRGPQKLDLTGCLIN